MKHNKIFAFFLAGVLSLGIVGCGSAGSSDSSSTEQAASSASGDLKPLRLGCPGFDDYPLLENGKLAYDKGYLEEYTRTWIREELLCARATPEGISKNIFYGTLL